MANDTDRVWDLMEKIGLCMLATKDGNTIRSRPMAAFVKREDGKIYFLTDARRHKDNEIDADPTVCLAFSDTSGQKYVSVSGNAQISHDKAKVHDLWSVAAKAWWDSPDDPNIRLLTVVPEDAEYWDSPGTIVSYVKMATAAMTGSRPAIGDNKKVNLS